MMAPVQWRPFTLATRTGTATPAPGAQARGWVQTSNPACISESQTTERAPLRS
eukprot:COSAG01_NODE_1741_length_9356_cov_13.065572_10_plen_53_part_00